MASLLFVVTVYCIYRADTGSWTYAYTMTALTFNFLLLLCYRQPELAVHAARLLMIVIGGLTTLLVSVAPPQLTAHEKARGFDLADAGRRRLQDSITRRRPRPHADRGLRRRRVREQSGLQVDDVILSICGESVEGLERYPINLRYPRDLRSSLSELRQLTIVTPGGEQISLSAVAEVEVEGGPES